MPFAPHVSVVIGRGRTLAAVLIGMAVGAIGCVESREPAPEACAALQIEFGYTILSLWIIAPPIVIEPGGAPGAVVPTPADVSAPVG